MTTREILELVLPVVISILSALILGIILHRRSKFKPNKDALNNSFKSLEQFFEKRTQAIRDHVEKEIRLKGGIPIKEEPQKVEEHPFEIKKEKPKLGQRKISFTNP